MRLTEHGHWFGGNGNAVLILKNSGQVLSHVQVMDEDISLVMPDLGRHEFKTSRVKTVVFKHLPTYPTDMLRLLDGTELHGEITNDPITVYTEDLGEIRVPKSNILTIIW